jgi:3-hydroxyisobutyrate dehydrogenase-like beta-hydroxyacid dehydrogenase
MPGEKSEVGDSIMPVLTIIAPGTMGSAVGERLVAHGLQVRTPLEGRSAASADRARAAGMVPVGIEQAAEADFVLSIVPPAAAISVAEQFASVLVRTRRKPVYADCNAVSPSTVDRIAAIIANTGSDFVDTGIIGGPPKPGTKGPVFYASGSAAGRLAQLVPFGLDVRVLGASIGAASALKMSYAGITKGLTALASVMIIAASRAGTAEALRRELGESQPALLSWFSRQIPGVFSKAYRWVGEMEEIAEFVGDDPAGAQIFAGAAQLYAALASGQDEKSRQLKRFFQNLAGDELQ